MTSPAEEWIAVCYSKSLKYIGRVISESETTIMANFLERRADGDYKIRQTSEEVDKGLVFLRNISVIWKGVGRYQLKNEREINSKQAEHWSRLRM